MSEEIVISQYVQMGKNVKIKPFTTIGLTGFGFEQEDGKYKIPLTRKEHNYKVIIGDNVEIGAGCVIDRGSWRDSVIGEGTKIDNLCHTGHNSVIGKNCLLAVGVTLGGSTTLGDNVFMGMQSMTKQGIKIGDNAVIGMGAVVTKDIPANTTVVGNPAYALLGGKAECLICGLHNIPEDQMKGNCPKCKGNLGYKKQKKVLGGGYIGW